MLPLWDTQKHTRTPGVTILLIVGCLAGFGYEMWQWIQGEAALEGFVTEHALVPARLVAGWRDGGEWATVVSHMFLHGGLGHLLGNCWFLWVFGNNVEERLGHTGFLGFYLVTGAAAAGAQLVVGPGSLVPMIGASGAISGVLGAYFVFFPKAWVITLVPWIVPILPIPAVVFLIVWFAMQTWGGVDQFLNPVGEGGVAWWAHVGGFVAGYVIARMVKGGRR